MPLHRRTPPSSRCPACGAEARCVDWLEYEYGDSVGIAEQQYECGWHGVFAFVEGPRAKAGSLGVWRARENTVVWRDCSPEEHQRHVWRGIEQGAQEIERALEYCRP